MNINEKIKLPIKTYISKSSEQALYNDISKIQQREYFKLSNAKYIVIQLFLQLGKPQETESPVLDFRNKNDIYLAIQPKIKSYMIFKSEENHNKYIQEEMDENDLYVVFEVENGKIKVR